MGWDQVIRVDRWEIPFGIFHTPWPWWWCHCAGPANKRVDGHDVPCSLCPDLRNNSSHLEEGITIRLLNNTRSSSVHTSFRIFKNPRIVIGYSSWRDGFPSWIAAIKAQYSASNDAAERRSASRGSGRCEGPSSSSDPMAATMLKTVMRAGRRGFILADQRKLDQQQAHR